VFTASKESFRLPTQKLKVLGHGIDTKMFQDAVREPTDGALHIMTVGRITRSKQILEILKSLDYLYDRNFSFEFTLIGKPVTKDDERYLVQVEKILESKPYHSHLFYRGAVAHDELPKKLANADVFINLSLTGSLDKAVLEAFASGVPAISSNEAFKSLLEPMRLFVPNDPREIADSIERFSSRTDRGWVAATLESWVKEHHSIQRLIKQIVSELT
jgi:glycosyltransferase involved in cell wall biosynthesis